LFVVSCCSAVQGQIVTLDSAMQGNYLGEYMHVLVDESSSSSLGWAMAQPHWDRVNEPVPNFGLSSSVYWFKLDLQAGVHGDTWVVEVSNVLLDFVDMYVVSSEGKVLDHVAGGSQRPLSKREILHRFNLIPIDTHDEGNLTLYFRVASYHSIQFPIALWPLHEFIAHDEVNTMLVGGLVGALFIMLLYNFFLYSALRDPIYLVYVGVVISFLMLQISLKGFGYRYFWQDQPGLASAAVFVSTYITVFFASTFAQWFLQLKQRQFRYNIALNVIRWSAIGSAFLVPWIPVHWRFYLVALYGISVVLIGFVAIFTYYRANDRPIQIFTAGWIVLLIGALLFLFNKLGWIPLNAWTEQTIAVGTVIEVILFSMALGDRINNEKEQTMRAKTVQLRSLDSEREEKQRILVNEEMTRKAKEVTLKIQQDTNLKLESEIDARTKKLQQATDQLKQLVRIDPLTEVYNRHHFNERIQEEFLRATREQAGLSLLMIDIDHFKSVNDQYGHLVGDKCLQAVARLIQKVVSQNGGALFRFGGEEFAVILHEVVSQKAKCIADDICTMICNTELSIEEGPTGITLSIGVASVYPKRSERPEWLVEKADLALYQAKKEGRNRVIVYADVTGQCHG
jgi:diguanylate cyclase (GGDEF)-like protein